MSTRLKERGGGGSKIIAPKSRKTVSDGLAPRHTSTPRLRSTPSSTKSGKENNLLLEQKAHRSISRGRSSVPRQRPTLSAATTTSVLDPPRTGRKPALVPASVVRWSTSTLPQGELQPIMRRSNATVERRSSIASGGGVAARVSKGSSASFCNEKSDGKNNGVIVQQHLRKDNAVLSSLSSRPSSVARKGKNAGSVVSGVVRMCLDEDGKSSSGKISTSILKRNQVVKTSVAVDLDSKDAAAKGKVCGVAFKDKDCLLPNSKAAADDRLDGNHVVKTTGAVDLYSKEEAAGGRICGVTFKDKDRVLTDSKTAVDGRLVDSIAGNNDLRLYSKEEKLVHLDSKEVTAAGKACRVDLNNQVYFFPNSESTVNNRQDGLAGSNDLCFDLKIKKDGSENHNDKDSVLLCSNNDDEKAMGVTGVVARSNETVLSDVDSKEIAVSVNDADRITVFENVDEKKPEQRGMKAGNGYSSELHEKLALLEGKVQRIATDIRKTKEMLDSDNPNSSKMMLSDIQNKILGIEKAVSNVIDGAEGDSGRTEYRQENDAMVRHFERCTKDLPIEIHDSKNSSKPLYNEELEARLFPHHSLLKSRRSYSVGKTHEPIISVNTSEAVPRDESQIPSEEESVALEFLASLNTVHPTINKRDGTTRSVIQMMGSEDTSTVAEAVICATNVMASGSCGNDVNLAADEELAEFDEQENKKTVITKHESDDSPSGKLSDIGHKTATGGWFISQGEAVLLTHSDGSCSFYDIANTEMKSQYMPSPNVPSNIWGDCWLIRAPGVDGSAGKYVVAASAGNALQSGFCSWDFYKKDIQALRVEGNCGYSSSSLSLSRSVLAPLLNVGLEQDSLSTIPSENRQWWYKPCGYLIASAASRQQIISAYDVRDGDLIMSWGVQNPVVAMENSSPLQWRNRNKMIVAETQAISLWDVNSLNPQALLSVSCGGKRMLALHVNNTDAEPCGGVRQRVSSSEIEGNDGVFCTQDSINVLDFRLQSGVGLKMPKDGSIVHSVYSRGDSVLLGSSKPRSIASSGSTSGVQHFSLRKGKLLSTYLLPDVKVHAHQSSLTQVWGNSNLVMGICGMGFFVFDILKGGVAHDLKDGVDARESIGSNDLYDPSFDYLGERVLLISRDRPAMWGYLS